MALSDKSEPWTLASLRCIGENETGSWTPFSPSFFGIDFLRSPELSHQNVPAVTVVTTSVSPEEVSPKNVPAFTVVTTYASPIKNPSNTNMIHGHSPLRRCYIVMRFV